MSPDSILKKVEEYDVIGVSSIFTPQASAVIDLIRLIRQNYPGKLIISGGVNARSLRARFFESGVDIIALSEAERTIVQIANAVHLGEDLTEIPGIAFCDTQGRQVINPTATIVYDLDELRYLPGTCFHLISIGIYPALMVVIFPKAKELLMPRFRHPGAVHSVVNIVIFPRKEKVLCREISGGIELNLLSGF